MRYFQIELDTRTLTAKQEDDLIDALENVYCDKDWWSEFYSGDFKVTPVSLPEYATDDDNFVYGKIVIEGTTSDDVLESIYDVFEGEVPYTDNDPYQVKMNSMIMDLIKFSVQHPKLGHALEEKASRIVRGVSNG